MKSLKNKIALLITIIGVIIIVSCSIDHKIPKANIEYIDFTETSKKSALMDIYMVSFLSDIPIDSLLSQKGDNSILYCSLDKTQNLPVESIDLQKRNLSGFFDNTKIFNETIKKYKYTAEMVFYNENGISSNKYLTNLEIKKLLAKKKCIKCKVYQRFFFDKYKPYLSNPMCIPVKDILKVINE